jgi:hypothetical protein
VISFVGVFEVFGANLLKTLAIEAIYMPSTNRHLYIIIAIFYNFSPFVIAYNNVIKIETNAHLYKIEQRPVHPLQFVFASHPGLWFDEIVYKHEYPDSNRRSALKLIARFRFAELMNIFACFYKG